MKSHGILFSFLSAIVVAVPVQRREVQALDLDALKQAQHRDDTATRALSGTQIKTFDGRCLRIDMLSGDSAANFTPVKVADCGSTNGQLWDIITAGQHNNQPGQMIIVNTLTQACFNVDPSGSLGDSVYLFSCGGRADGGGQATGSQLFAFDGGQGPLSLQPKISQGQCLYVDGDNLGMQPCNSDLKSQAFVLSNGASQPPAQSSMTRVPAPGSPFASKANIATVAATPTPPALSSVAESRLYGSSSSAPSMPPPSTTTIPRVLPTLAIPVSQAGGVLQPSAAAAANQFDPAAVRAVQRANIRVADGRCLSIDPAAGDSRQNLIPVQLAKCSGDETQKFDLVTRGRHNDGTTGVSLIVSSLTNGCISFDPRSSQGDTVTLFSCGGRADGEGQTDLGQLFPYQDNSTTLVMEPQSDHGQTCLIPGQERLESAPCDEETQPKSVFQIIVSS